MIVELIYLADAQQVFQKSITLDAPCTIKQLIIDSDLLERYPELVIEDLSVGCFSKPRQLDDEVQQGDRIEVYRPLTISPMDKRRLLAERKK